LFPARADLRRLAGERLERLGARGQALAVDSYTKALEQRPDHLNAYRLLAWALVRARNYEKACATLEAGLNRGTPEGRFLGVPRILAEDLAIVGAAWSAA